MLEQLRETAGQGGPAAGLANQLLVYTDQYQSGELSKEDYQYLVQEIAEVKAQQELANDEIACRYIYEAATTLLSAVA